MVLFSQLIPAAVSRVTTEESASRSTTLRNLHASVQSDSPDHPANSMVRIRIILISTITDNHTLTQIHVWLTHVHLVRDDVFNRLNSPLIYHENMVQLTCEHVLLSCQ